MLRDYPKAGNETVIARMDTQQGCCPCKGCSPATPAAGSAAQRDRGIGETTLPNNRNKKPPEERVVFISSVALVGRQVVIFRKTS